MHPCVKKNGIDLGIEFDIVQCSGFLQSASTNYGTQTRFLKSSFKVTGEGHNLRVSRISSLLKCVAKSELGASTLTKAVLSHLQTIKIDITHSLQLNSGKQDWWVVTMTRHNYLRANIWHIASDCVMKNQLQLRVTVVSHSFRLWEHEAFAAKKNSLNNLLLDGFIIFFHLILLFSFYHDLLRHSFGFDFFVFVAVRWWFCYRFLCIEQPPSFGFHMELHTLGPCGIGVWHKCCFTL